jgi:membrane dipeptidase
LLRREFLTGSLAVFAAPLLGSASISRRYSTRAVDLVSASNVVDMLGLLTLDWPLLDRWHQDPSAFTDADFQKLRDSGINVFHPAVAFETQSHEVTRTWFEKWNRFIAWHPDYFLRVDGRNDLARARQEGRIGIILGMQDSNHLRSVDDVDAFYGMGQRLTQLTYNSANDLGDGCKVSQDRGLSAFGLAVVERMNSIGMAIDVSHCGQRTSLDAIAGSSCGPKTRSRSKTFWTISITR